MQATNSLSSTETLTTYLSDISQYPLLTVQQVDSRQDPRVQVADLLAGIARRLHRRPGRLLRPYLVGGPPSLDPPTTLTRLSQPTG